MKVSSNMPENRTSHVIKKRLTFKNIFDTIQETTLRFTFPLLFVIGLSILLFINVHRNDANIGDQYWAFFGLGIAMSIAVALFTENFKSMILRLALNLTGVLLLGVYVFLLPEKLLSVHYYQLIVVGLAFVVAAFVVSFYQHNNDTPFWEFGKTTILQLIISFIFASVLMLGLSLAILSLQKLFNIDISSKMYGYLSISCYVLFQPFYFLSNILKEKDKYTQVLEYNKFLKLLGLYILLPILAIYTVILYVYLIQIIAAWELPNGWVTWLVSVLALAGFVTLLIQYPLRVEHNKTARIFAKLFPVILIPLLILMTVGISRRFDDYGLTINRAFVFLLNFWLYGISIYLIVSRSKHLKWILISFSSIAFLSVVGPWSVLNITKHSMQQEVTSILATNHYIINDKVVSKALASKIIISKEDHAMLTSNIEYLIDNYGVDVLNPLFEDVFKAQSKDDIFVRLNIEEMYYENAKNKEDYFNATLSDKNFSLAIDSFNHFVSIKILDEDLNYNDSLFSIEYKNHQLVLSTHKEPSTAITIHLKDKIEALSRAGYSNYTLQNMSIVGSNYKLLIVEVNAQLYQPNNGIKINRLEGFIFLK